MASKIVVNLDTSKDAFLNSKCKQNDDLILEANIYENGASKDLTNCSIVVQAKKADNTYIIQNTDITKDKNKFIAELVRDFTRVPGETKIEVVLTESSKQNTTFSFILEVDASVIKGAEESKDLITSLEVMQDAVVEMGKISEETKELIQNSGAASKEEINKVNTQLAEKANEIDLIVERKRIDVFTNLKEGSTTGDAELIDGRVSSSGKIYGNIGESIRAIGKGEGVNYKALNESKISFITHGKNYISKDMMKFGYYMKHNANGVIVANQSYYLSEYIFIKANIDFYISSFRFISVFDLSYNFKNEEGIESIDNSGKTFRFSEDRYIRVSVEKSNFRIDVLQLEEGTVGTKYEPYYLTSPNLKVEAENILGKFANSLTGKIAVNFGDSIADGVGNNGKGYMHIIAENNGMILHDYANGGATIARRETNNILDQLQTAISSGIQPDYIVFNGGTNDIVVDKNIELGTMTTAWSGQAIDETTYIGGMESMCKKIKTTFPNAKVIWVRVHNMGSRDYNKQIEYGEAGVKVCEKWGVVVVDLFKNSNLNTNINTMWQFTSNNDGTHPNEPGYLEFYVPQIESKLLNS